MGRSLPISRPKACVRDKARPEHWQAQASFVYVFTLCLEASVKAWVQALVDNVVTVGQAQRPARVLTQLKEWLPEDMGLY